MVSVEVAAPLKVTSNSRKICRLVGQPPTQGDGAHRYSYFFGPSLSGLDGAGCVVEDDRHGLIGECNRFVGLGADRTSRRQALAILALKATAALVDRYLGRG